MKYRSGALDPRKHHHLAQAELVRNLTRGEALDLEQGKGHALTLGHLLERGLYELEIALVLERLGGSAAPILRVELRDAELLRAVQRFRGTTPLPAPPVGDD